MVVKYEYHGNLSTYQRTKESLEFELAPARYAIAVELSYAKREVDKFNRMVGIYNGILGVEARIKEEALTKILDIIDDLPNKIEE